MDKISRSATEDAAGLPLDLASLSAASEEDALRIVSEALNRAARPDADTGESARIDRELLSALRHVLQPDPVLERLDLELLAGLLERCTSRLGSAGEAMPPIDARREGWDVLDLVRRPSVLRRIEPAVTAEWTARILALVEASHLTVGPLLLQRVERYGSKILFQVPRAGGTRGLTWRRTGARVELLARALLALEDGAPVAILSENRLEMALLDLACLATGMVNVMVPANSTERDVGYILRHSGARTVIVSGRAQLRKVQAQREALPLLRHVVVIDAVAGRNGDATSWQTFTAGAEQVPASRVTERAEAVRVEDLATVMYTSGTTGAPKAIQFSQRNLIFKRFARAMALPEIGEQDVFLCFLPLFHTFGRFLELLGCVFLGATYTFLGGTSAEALIRGMRRYRPTVFISVPKKWIQLHEAIALRADPHAATEEQLREATRAVTGGRLRWGLSAAGHLDSDIFRFFHSQGVELVSGFGMTEATGGITMTPPGEYREGSLGVALPGIELKLGDDGELWIRGPYVMIGYLDPPDGEQDLDEEGWLPTGDLMEIDNSGHLRLVDRKKEIYKNIKGETIAPQRIENLFRELESVGRAFLVGDHREYNTLLIHPAPDFEEMDFFAAPREEVLDHFRSLVVSVNKFLAPYERIVDFAIIDRDLDESRGELTAKGTPRRAVVARHFNDVIQTMYQRTNLSAGELQLTIPNWLFQNLGLTARDIAIGEQGILLPSTGARLTVRGEQDGLARVGSFLYAHPGGPLNLGALLTAPRLWLGNEELVEFVRLDSANAQRHGRIDRGLEWRGRPEPYPTTEADRTELLERIGKSEWTLDDVDHAARLLGAEDDGHALAAIRLIERILGADEGPLAEPARLVLTRAAGSTSVAVRSRALQVLAPAEREVRFPATLRRFLESAADMLDANTRAVLVEQNLSEAKLEAFAGLCQERALEDDPTDDDRRLTCGLLSFLAEYGAAHPVRYRRLRAFLVRVGLFATHADVRGHAFEQVAALRDGFRQWLGPTARMSVDPETGQEYRWEDVVAFDEAVPPAERERLLIAIKETALLREAVFLFSHGSLIRLSDVPPGGVWIRLLGARHGKSVYRVTIQTRFLGHHDLAINVNHELSEEQVLDEMHWLILSGDSGDRAPLVEDFGGYWGEPDLWSEEFISGEPLARAMRRLSRRDEERFRNLWPFLAWTALSAYVDFWHRSGHRWEIADPSMTNVVVPTDDYQTGVRIVSVSARRPHGGIAGMIRSFRDEFIEPAEQLYPALAGLVGWEVIFSSVLEVVGEEQGVALLQQMLEDENSEASDELSTALTAYLSTVRVRGFLPRRLFFAAKRYRRWSALSEDATPQARARTLQELYDTYGLRALALEYPEVRIRFYLETVFRDAPPPLIEGLEKLIDGLRTEEWIADDLIDLVADLRSRLDLPTDNDYDYFLARLSLPYLRPEDAADFVSGHLGGDRQSDIVVTLEDQDGTPFRVRHAINPKEVGRLHRLFLSAKLDVRFRLEHRYLVALSDRAQIIGGIYYEVEDAAQSAHLEKIVVTDRFRRKGVADGLMNELFNRLRAAGLKTVTTGFFRPEYFYAYGFRIEKRYAGLVKSLAPPAESPPGDRDR